MTRSRRRVVRFSRHYRRHPKYDLGTPPRSVGHRLRKIPLLRLALVTVGALLLLPPLVTAAAGMLRPTEQGCRILWAVDGDTVWAWCPTDGLMSTRLTGFDTPEFNGHCGSERLRAMAATYVLRWQIWTAGEIGMRALGRDRYGRRLAAVTVDGDALADRMIASGLARPYDGGRRASWCDR